MTVSHPAIDDLADTLERIANMGDKRFGGMDELRHKIRVSRDAVAGRLIRQEQDDPRRLKEADIDTLERLDIQWAFLNSTEYKRSQERLSGLCKGHYPSGDPTLAAHFRRVLADPSLADKKLERMTVKLESPAPKRS
jgi:hypothetical protein